VSLEGIQLSISSICRSEVESYFSLLQVPAWAHCIYIAVSSQDACKFGSFTYRNVGRINIYGLGKDN